MATTAIDLKPIAGFCIKSSLQQPAVFTAAPQPSLKGQNVLEPSKPDRVPLPIGLKVFINIAWDANVPPPPPGSEDVIQRAMQGEDVDENNPEGWYVPVIVSEGRQDKDKAGKLSLVFDCIYHNSIKIRTLTDPEFKLFIIELALQRIEAQSGLVLSRQVGTPNIASKGKLTPRTVNIPTALLSSDPIPADAATSPVLLGEKKAPVKNKSPLIEEVAADITSPPSQSKTDKPKGILKKTGSSASAPSKPNGAAGTKSKPTWRWSKQDAEIQITVNVPSLTRTLIEQSSLDIEDRRFILQIPDYPILDVDLSISDAEIVAKASSKVSVMLSSAEDGGDNQNAEPNNTLTLKRQRALDVDGAKAEWRVDEGVLIITA